MDTSYEQNYLTKLPFGELEACPSSASTALFAFLDSGIPGQKSGTLEDRAERNIYAQQRFADPMFYGTCLPRKSSTPDVYYRVESADGLGEFERLRYNHLGCLPSEIGVQRTTVN